MKQEGGGVKEEGDGLLGCHCLLAANIDDAQTSATSGWGLAAAGPVHYFM